MARGPRLSDTCHSGVCAPATVLTLLSNCKDDVRPSGQAALTPIHLAHLRCLSGVLAIYQMELPDINEYYKPLSWLDAVSATP